MVQLPLFNTSFRNVYRHDNLPTHHDLGYDDVTEPTLPLSEDNMTDRRRIIKRKIIFDFLGIAGIFAFVFVFYMILKPPTQLFRLDDTSLMYPLLNTKIPSILAGTLSILLPIFGILAFNIFFVWNKWDIYSGFYGTILAYALSLLITSMMWYFVGGLRPHFLELCQVDQSLIRMDQIYYTMEICTNKNAFNQDTFHGFPSGHASTAFAGCVFLSCYLASHLLIYRNGNGSRIFIAFLPILCAVWLASSRLADFHHSPLQLFAGILIGTFSAFLAYHLAYIQGFWFGYGRYAHIPRSLYPSL